MIPISHPSTSSTSRFSKRPSNLLNPIFSGPFLIKVINFIIELYIANKKTSSVDPDEDEPHLEEAWPHL